MGEEKGTKLVDELQDIIKLALDKPKVYKQIITDEIDNDIISKLKKLKEQNG